MKITEVKKGTTGIGSLPHHHVDPALEYAFQFGIPFLPQIPIRHPQEFMIAQALEGLPGLEVRNEGEAILNLEAWKSLNHLLEKELKQAFSEAHSHFQSFEKFEPTSLASSLWLPFLWELQERKTPVAKIQIAGPFTCQWALQIQQPQTNSIEQLPELASQIYQLILARAIGMIRKVRSLGVQALIFLDEPGLYAFSVERAAHLSNLHELKWLIQSLQKEGAWVGLHCCSDTNWSRILGLGMNILSIDTGVSLKSALWADHGKRLKDFILSGGTLSLGVIPTHRSWDSNSFDAQEMSQQLVETFRTHWYRDADLIRQTLMQSLYTPACGLAFQSTSAVETLLESLDEFYENITHS